MENYDSELEEVKELVRRNTLLAQDTNKMVHSMRRGQRWRSLFSIAWWILIFGISAYSYLTYVQPYVTQVLKAYGGAQDFQQQIQGAWGQYFGSSTKN